MSAATNGWRPISTAPKDGRLIWLRLHLPNGIPMAREGYFTDPGVWVQGTGGAKMHGVTHWQPTFRPSPDLTPAAPTPPAPEGDAEQLRRRYTFLLEDMARVSQAATLLDAQLIAHRALSLLEYPTLKGPDRAVSKGDQS